VITDQIRGRFTCWQLWPQSSTSAFHPGRELFSLTHRPNVRLQPLTMSRKNRLVSRGVRERGTRS
jgi:hypothetical protein